MRDPAVRLVLLPRYTALYGGNTIYSPPIDVRRFEKVILTAWKGKGIGSTPADVAMTLEQSVDLDIWNAGSGWGAWSLETEKVVELDLQLEWARLAVGVSSAVSLPGITVWVVGTFVPRVRPG